jgi:hypothetical protein
MLTEGEGGGRDCCDAWPGLRGRAGRGTLPACGAGGKGRAGSPAEAGEDDRYWTAERTDGGPGVHPEGSYKGFVIRAFQAWGDKHPYSRKDGSACRSHGPRAVEDLERAA